jgi:hypothetical protein
MIVIAKPRASQSHAQFLAMLPAIREQARIAFRAAQPELREELVQEVVANAFCAYQRLVERGRENIAYPTPLAQFAIRQVRSGRRVGTTLNVNDISSRHAQVMKGVIIERLDQFDPDECQWREALVEDRRAGPAETAAARIDVAAWFNLLPGQRRRIAKTLAQGETTGATACKFGLSAGRISQLRQELEASWQQFQEEAVG